MNFAGAGTRSATVVNLVRDKGPHTGTEPVVPTHPFSSKAAIPRITPDLIAGEIAASRGVVAL